MTATYKPTPDELRELKRLEAEVDAFVEEVTTRAEAILDRIHALLDAAGAES